MSVISLLSGVAGIRARTVMIDVYRSSNTIIEALAKGADRVVPVGDEAAARRLKSAHPDWLALGERGGERLKGFDGDNSPSGLPELLSGRTVLLTTSAGTRCIDACPPDVNLYVGSFANARSLIALLRAEGDDEPAFWAVGLAGVEVAEEDELCAEHLDRLWHGAPSDLDTMAARLVSCAGADRLRRLGQTQDLAYCQVFDSRRVVPRRQGDRQMWSLVA